MSLNRRSAAAQSGVIKRRIFVKQNPFGGAIALTIHQLLLVLIFVIALINALDQLDGKIVVASLCVGGGMGVLSRLNAKIV